ncbi:MAG: hypothetical protein JW943_09150 [Deltaproteobacteria bacterium]|nr:hypothetical protein [Deltaproteobacteria bacterium]
MTEQLLLLIELQNIDSAVRGINMKKKELPDKIGKLDEAFAALKISVEQDAKAVDDLQKGLREKEEKLKRGIDTIKKAKDRLTEVKTNKEYQAALKEIEGIEIKNSEGEDEIILTMEELDKLRSGLKIKEQDMESYRSRYEKEKADFEKALLATDAELVACQEKGVEIRSRIDGDILKRYEIIKNRNNGLAVVSVWKEVCRGCHMNIPPQLYNELLTATTLFFCPNCNRIMYPESPEKNG